MLKSTIILCLYVCCSFGLRSQLRINEAGNRNFSQVYDEFGETEDWIEIYNAGSQAQSLLGYGLSDDPGLPQKWIFPSIALQPGSHLLLFASGRNLSSAVDHWEAAVVEGQPWLYRVGAAFIPANWNQVGVNPLGFSTGPGGFGFGDNDDATVLPTDIFTAYIRTDFQISDTTKVERMTLSVDYDDAFVAYLNGVEIARNNFSGQVAHNVLADGQHEAAMYQGGAPEHFILDMNQIRGIWNQGSNTLSLVVINATQNSSDLTLRPWLHVGLRDANTYWSAPEPWFASSNLGSLHTNFKLSSEGETVFLFDPQGALVDALTVDSLMTDWSVGSQTDGSILRVTFQQASPGSTNNTQTGFPQGWAPAPVFTTPAGFYGGAISVGFQMPPPGFEIRYTTNGGTPTATDPLFTGTNLGIGQTTFLRARTFHTAGQTLPSEVGFASYYIQVSHDLPVISISANPDDLFGPNGICDNWWTDWKKPCHVDYYDTLGQLKWSQKAGIKIEGGAGGSRSHPQKSFRVEPGNGALGDGNLNFPLVPDRAGRTDFERFYLRNGSNQYLTLPYKDALLVKLMGKYSFNNYSAYTPVVVYLNGSYNGVYELREKQDVNYCEALYQADTDSLDILSVSYWYGSVLRAVEGSTEPFLNDYNWFTTLNPTDPQFLNQAGQVLDIPYYNDYIAAQAWVGNTDWPWNNIKIFRGTHTQKKWRYGLIDLEWALNPNGWTDNTHDGIGYLFQQGPNEIHANFWYRLIQNDQYKNYFINRFADLMNTSWLWSAMDTVEANMYQESLSEAPGQFARWGTTTVANHMNSYAQNHQTMRNQLAGRSPFVRNHLRYHFSLPKNVNVALDAVPLAGGSIQISTINPGPLPWQGIYFDGVPVKLTALAEPGYAFSHWEPQPHIINGNNPVWEDTITDNSVLFKAHFTFLYLPSDSVRITELNYQDHPGLVQGDWVEVQNQGSTPAHLKGWSLRDANQNTWSFPDDLVLPPGGFALISRDTAAFATIHPGLQALSSPLSFGLGNGSDSLFLIHKNGNTIDSVGYSDGAGWPRGANGRGRTLEREVSMPGMQPSGWFDGCMKGSPLAPYTPCQERVLVSEVMYKPASTQPSGDWFELFNPGSQPIDISAWRVNDEAGNSFTLPIGETLAAGQRRVLAQDLSLFSQIHSGVLNPLGPTGIALSSNLESVFVADAVGNLQFSLCFDGNAPWPNQPNGGGPSLEMLDSTGKMNQAQNWFPGCPEGSPGTWFKTCQTSVDALAEMPFHVYPNPFFLDLTLESPMAFNARLIDVLGKTVWTGQVQAGENKLQFAEEITPGWYALLNEKGHRFAVLVKR